MLKQSTLSFGNSQHAPTSLSASNKQTTEFGASPIRTSLNLKTDTCTNVKKLKTGNPNSENPEDEKLCTSTHLQPSSKSSEEDSPSPIFTKIHVSNNNELSQPQSQEKTKINLDDVELQNDEELNDRIPNIPHTNDDCSENPSDSARTLALDAVTSLIKLADVHPQEVIPLFRVGKLLRLVTFYERLRPIWDNRVECKVSATPYFSRRY